MLAQDLAVNQMFGINDVDDALGRGWGYLQRPQDVSVTGFTELDETSGKQTFNCSDCYGAEFLFQRYLYDRFGGDQYLHNMLGSGTVSYANITQSTGVDVTQDLSDFAVALAASNTGATNDPRFNFTGINLRSTPTDQFGRGSLYTLNGPFAMNLVTSNNNHLLGSFFYLNGDASARGKTVTIKDPTGSFALRGAVVQH